MFSQTTNRCNISGVVKSSTNEKLPFCLVYLLEENKYSAQTNEKGEYLIKNVPYGNYILEFQFLGFEKQQRKILLNKSKFKLNIVLKEKAAELDVFKITSEKEGFGTMRRMRSIEGLMITEGKKNEVIQLAEIDANKATNQGRQIYSRIPGLNIWESDGAGLQLGIGGRGLNPNRTSNFNTRQNGYDISADALGYPESYYTPPSEAVKEIQLIRGAASLQFGTQFGGLLNFKLHDGPVDKDFEVVYRHTFGSFNLNNTFMSVGFKEGVWKGYGYFQLKKGNEWRPNSGFEVYSGAFNITNYISEKASVNIQYTKMYYLAQQPGGLTDKEFYNDPLTSKRERNWFEVDWNLFATSFNYEFNAKTKVKSQFFGLYASRKSLGVLGNISRPDNTQEERDLIVGEFKNYGNETRLLHIYNVGKQNWAFVVGGRFYKGFNVSKQGKADTTNSPHFTYNNPDELEGSDYAFPSTNYAAFAEHIFRLGKRFSVTPGFRFENINTNAEGSYRDIIYDLAQNPIFDTTFTESRSNSRSFVILGLGLNYKFNDTLDIYANFTQNYRSINFADMQIKNKNFRIDPNLEDETGYNFDIGARGFIAKKLSYDVSGFVLLYDNRIGNIDQVDENTFIPYRYRTNVSKATVKGVEAVIELDWWKIIFSDTSKFSFRTFVNASYIDARYTDSKNTAFNDKLVEFVPPVTLKTGFTIAYKNFSASYQFSYVKEHYTDATNAGKDINGNLVFIPNAIIGTIPSYSVMDLSLKYDMDRIRFEGGINNLTNQSYFTRRATGYPGPGIIPSAIRNYYFTIQLKI
ncbi:MAG: TonB-dependent receptor [Flavobacteriales bacterium]|nr:TonB-dependent receptor [Flavobacteriales bacterium]